MTAPLQRVRAAPSPSWTMFRAVVGRAVRDQRRSMLAWGLSLGALCAFVVAVYPSMQSSIQDISENYPKGLKEAFGVSDMSTVEGYLHAEMFSLMVPLGIGIFAVRAVVRTTVAAEEQGHLDTILALPLPRRVLMAGAFAASALLSAGVLLITGLLTLAVSPPSGAGLSAGLLAAGVAGVWPLAVFFAGAAVLAAGVTHRTGVVTGAATGLLAAMYVLDLAARITDSLDALRYASAFALYGTPLRDGLDVAAFGALTALGLALAVAGAILFERRDVRH